MSVVRRIPVNDPGRAAAAHRTELRQVLDGVLASGRYVQGPRHDAFEDELAAFLGVGHCLGVASGTDALELALLGVGCEAGRRGRRRGERRQATPPQPPAGSVCSCASPTSTR